MSEKKDFLNQFSNENKKPESFKEEVRIPVSKPKKPLNPLMIIIPIVALILIAFLVWFFFLRATIEMPNFVGKTQSDIAQWVTQQGIERNGIVFDEEYSMEYDEDVIMSQSVDAGTMVKKDVKINFVMSLGADPDEPIEVPDIMGMSQSELNAWKEENKLNNTRITTAYSDTVADGQVISFNFRGCEAEEFTRGCTLNISVSKGPAPAGTVVISDFKNNPLSNVESWAETNKIVLDIRHAFDDEVASGMVISTSPEANKTLKQGETLTVTVSQGQGVTVPDLSSMARKEVDNWLEANAQYVNVERRYADVDGYIIKQNVKAGAMIGTEDKLEITLNEGNTFYAADLGLDVKSLVGEKYSKLIDWCNENRYLGIDAYAGQWGTNSSVYSKYPKDTIVAVECSGYSDGKVYDCNDRLPLDVRFSVVLSKGEVVDVDFTNAVFESNGQEAFETSKVVEVLAANNIAFDNNAGGLSCIIKINGQEVKADNPIVRIVKEEDKVSLEPSSINLPDPTPIPSPTTETEN